jgi:hypothetical protein
MSTAHWARKHTSPDAAFLVDPDWAQFREIAERPLFGAWKDGSALLWSRGFAPTWVERMEALGWELGDKSPLGGEPRLERLYARLDDQAARHLSVRYGLSYWVVPIAHKSALPTVYHNHYWKVLDLRVTQTKAAGHLSHG